MRIGIRPVLSHQFYLCKVTFFMKHLVISPILYEESTSK